MSGHSKWSQIKRAKGAADAKRGQLFSKLTKLVTIAAQQGGADPAANPRLRIAIEQARAANMPKDNIDRAIKRGTGELAGARVEEVRFEIYGPGGIGILVEAATDNPNRTTAGIKATLNKYGGKLAAPGAVAYQFVQRGLVTIPVTNQPVSQDGLELAIIEAGADSYEDQGDALVVLVDPKALTDLKQILDDQGIKIAEAKLSWEPNQTVAITDPATASRILRLMDALEELDDVTTVTANFAIPDNVLADATT